MKDSQRLWIIVSLVVINASFVAGVVSWRWREPAPEVNVSPYLKALAEFHEAELPHEKYMKALNVVATLDPSISWWEIRLGGASATEADRISGADAAHIYVATIARKAAKFEASWTAEDRARIKRDSADSFLAQADLLESFRAHNCGAAEYRALRAKFSVDDLQKTAYAAHVLVTNEDWNGGYLVRRAVRRLLKKNPRFENDHDLATTFYDEDALKFLMTPARLGVGPRFPAKYLRSSFVESYLLRHGVRQPEIRSLVMNLVKRSPGCWTPFESLVPFVNDEYTKERGHALAQRLAQIYRVTGALPGSLDQLTVATGDNAHETEDGWQSPFLLTQGETPAIVSPGADKLVGTSDDLVFLLNEEGDPSNAKGTGL